MTFPISSDPTKTAFAFLQAGNLVRAEAEFRAILAERPGQPDALHGMACLAQACGQEATAIALAGRAVQARDVSQERRARIHITLGQALLAQGHAEAARAALTVAAMLQPADPRAHASLCEALLALGRRGEARDALERAALLAADDAALRTRLGGLLLEDGLSGEAVGQFRLAVSQRPEDGAALANLGAALFERNAFDEAREVLLRACVLGARTAETLNTLGLVQMALGDLGAACETLTAALALRPWDGRIANSLGTALMEVERLDEASRLFAGIMERETGAEEARARFNRATILLGQGRFAEGWRDFESRRVILGTASDVPQWDGSVGSGPVAVVGEQGLGDEVQFLRFLTEAAKRRPLRLRFRAAGLATLMPELDQERILPAQGPVEAEISLLSLPAVLGLEDEPSRRLYLAVAERVERGRIGLCWSGNPSYRFDRRRSVPVECLEVLRQVHGVRFVALQRGDAPDWMARETLETPLDLARAVARCELVISVDTLVAHVAGATGRPLWLLNREGGDWRWKDVAWYGNVRQFRPPSGMGIAEGWEAVLRNVAAALSSWERARLPGGS